MTRDGAWNAIRRLIFNPWAIPMEFAIALTGAHLFPAALSTREDMASAMDSLQAALLALPSNPIFQLGFLATSIVCLWVGVRRIETAERKRAADTKAAIAPVKAAMDNFNEWRKVERADEHLGRARLSRQKRKLHFVRVSGQEETHFSSRDIFLLETQFDNIRQSIDAGLECLGVRREDQSISPVHSAPNFRQADNDNAAVWFDMRDIANQQYLAAEARLDEVLDRALKALEDQIAQKRLAFWRQQG